MAGRINRRMGQIYGDVLSNYATFCDQSIQQSFNSLTMIFVEKGRYGQTMTGNALRYGGYNALINQNIKPFKPKGNK